MRFLPPNGYHFLFAAILAAAPLSAVEDNQLAVAQPSERPRTATQTAQTDAPLTPEPVAVTPTPAPTATPIGFFAPLSLDNCVRLINKVQRLLPADRVKFDETQDATYSLRKMIEAVTNYLQFRDDLHTSLADYAWIDLIGRRGKVENEPGGRDNDSFDLEPPVANISALSFEVQEGDAYLHSVTVYPADGAKPHEFVLKPERLLRNRLPRREVFHLWKSTDISRIAVSYSRATLQDGPTPVVRIKGGVTGEPDSIKAAIYWLRRSSEAIARQDVPETRNALARARYYLEEFIRTNRIR